MQLNGHLLYLEGRVGPGVRVPDLHVEASERGPERHVLGDRDTILLTVERRRLVVDVADGDGDVGHGGRGLVVSGDAVDQF